MRTVEQLFNDLVQVPSDTPVDAYLATKQMFFHGAGAILSELGSTLGSKERNEGTMAWVNEYNAFMGEVVVKEFHDGNTG